MLTLYERRGETEDGRRGKGEISRRPKTEHSINRINKFADRVICVILRMEICACERMPHRCFGHN